MKSDGGGQSMKDKKTLQLGMNPSTASGRLVKDLLWHFVQKAGQDCCFHCGGKMTRENFSVEHKTPWLDSEDPISMFFDIENISFSHSSCNFSAARKTTKLNLSPEERKDKDRVRKKVKWDSLSKEEQQKLRRSKYERFGK